MKTNESNTISLSSPISNIKGFGPKKAESLERLGITKLLDSLYFYPRLYEDMRNKIKICDLKDGDRCFVVGKVLLLNFGKGFGINRVLHLLIEDNTGRMEVLFFNAGYMKNVFKIGFEYGFFGKVKHENGRSTMFHPSYSLYDKSNTGILPVYTLTKGLSQKDLRKLTQTATDHLDQLPESLPQSVISDANICSNAFALKNIHYPEDENSYKQSRYRLIYEELFDLKTALALSKGGSNSDKQGIIIDSTKGIEFANSLPYQLTKAQTKALNEVLSDLKSGKRMNRLIQGDVGSGKTAVAMAALAEAVGSGYQGLFMAPTEILAQQHYETLSKAFTPLGITVVMLTSSMSAREKKDVLLSLKEGRAMIAVGTHALISSGVEYNNVGLVITDEQHRFGVSQREKLGAKGAYPHILVMTATPIPRTLAVVLYADLDISIIDELPPGRKPITTMKYDQSKRSDAYKLLLNEVSKGRQAYIVAPFIEDSESIEGKSAVSLYEEFTKKHPHISCGLLHGELKNEEKDEIMLRFKMGEISVLICTVVIEVGIDVPNASIMLIENSERFGLAQMHQLRGRVGRGPYESYCLICSENESPVSKQRAEILCNYSDGFLIAEKDLEIRGPGEFFGYRQHGLPQLVLADPIKHSQLAKRAGQDAEKLLEKDPNLSLPENSIFAKKMQDKFMKTDTLTI